jgi:hypothetical protein
LERKTPYHLFISDRQGVFVNLLQEAGSLSVGDEESAANDTPGDFVMTFLSAFIGVHRRLSFLLASRQSLSRTQEKV